MGLFDVLSGAASFLLDAAGKNADHVYRERAKIIQEQEKKVDAYESIHGDSERTAAAREKIAAARTEKLRTRRDQEVRSAVKRRSDKEIGQDRTGIDKNPEDFPCCTDCLLSEAVHRASSETGVYILFLDGQVMKCGRAAYRQGVRWRMVQYYNLNYDGKAQRGDCWSVSLQNRDRVRASWQCCPAAKCRELEYKLFQKYGKGPWAKRAPASCGEDTWPLLI